MVPVIFALTLLITINVNSFEKSEPSRVVGLLDERGEAADAVVEVVVAESHGSVVE